MGILRVWQRVGAEVRGTREDGGQSTRFLSSAAIRAAPNLSVECIRLLLKIHLKKEFQGLTNKK